MTLNLCTSLQNQKRCPETIDRKKKITQSRYRSLSTEQKPTKRSTLIVRQFSGIQLVHRYVEIVRRRSSVRRLFATSRRSPSYARPAFVGSSVIGLLAPFVRNSSVRRFFDLPASSSVLQYAVHGQRDWNMGHGMTWQTDMAIYQRHLSVWYRCAGDHRRDHRHGDRRWSMNMCRLQLTLTVRVDVTDGIVPTESTVDMDGTRSESFVLSPDVNLPTDGSRNNTRCHHRAQ